MKITLFSVEKYRSIVLPQKLAGRHWLQCEIDKVKPENIVAVEAEQIGKDDKSSAWVAKSNKQFTIIDKNNNFVQSVHLNPNDIYRVQSNDKKNLFVMFVEEYTEDRKIHTAYRVTHENSIIKIGSDSSSDIVYSNRMVSTNHAEIEFSHEYKSVRDLDSKNKVYVNGKTVESHNLKVADVIYIMGLQIIIANDFLFVNNPDGNVRVNQEKLQKVEPFLVSSHEDNELDELEHKYYYREPRFKYGVDTFEFALDAPPSAQSNEELPLMMLVGPSVTMGMASLASGMFAFTSAIGRGDIMSAMPSLVMSMSMLLGTLMWPMITKRYQRKSKRKKEEKRQIEYKKYLVESEKMIADEIARQERILRNNDGNFITYMHRVLDSKPLLWERTSKHSDFLSLRLGHGNIPLKANIEYSKRKFSVENDNLIEEMYKFGEKNRILHDVPICLPIADRFVSGIYANKKMLITYARNLIMQIITLHSYDEVKLVLLYNVDDAEELSFVKFLPHVMNDEKTVRYIATNSDEAKDLSYALDSIIETRKQLGENKIEEESPHYVVLCLDKALSAKSECVRRVLEHNENIKFSVLSLFENLNDLPKECSAVVEIVNYREGKLTYIDDVSAPPLEFKVDVQDTDGIEEAVCVISNTEIDITGFDYVLPKKYTFFEMLEVGMLEHLNILENWSANDPTKSLAAVVGVDRFSEPFKIDLHEKAHGPHGLIAGMTGSGKSEFIITYILSMAINYHPCEVAFILIDYKGGGMAKSFESIPHTAGIITNLDGNGIKRSLISMKSELHRRERIFRTVSEQKGISNIDIYKYQKLFREGKVSEPLPHLIIVSDEFAELKKEQPEFMSELTSTARVGRSLGVHLILATQKPGGVVDDQIRSNSRFKVCLKVQDGTDSMEMLGRNDAATLVDTGRFYLQVGYNEIFEMGQSSWSGAPYYPSQTVIKDKDDAVSIINTGGKIISEANIDRFSVVKDPPKQLDVVTSYINKICEEEKIEKWKMWLDPIPDTVINDELADKYQRFNLNEFELNPVIGEYDNPAMQKQGLLTLPISKDGNVIVYGSSGSGKAMFIESMCYSLIRDYEPSAVNIYILDFGAETLNCFNQAPHVGDVILSYQKEKIDNLFNMLFDEMNHRKKALSEFAGDLSYYNMNAETPIANIVVVINNYAVFTEIYEEKNSEINFITREGVKYGIYFVLACTGVNNVRFNMMQNFKTTYCLQLNNIDDYSTVVGKTEGMIPEKFKGRGIFRDSNLGLLEFQVASITNQSVQYDYIRNYCKTVSSKFKGVKAKRIPVLPDKVDKAYLNELVESFDLERMPVGIDKITLEPSFYNFKENVINLVLSSGQEWKSFVASLESLISEKYETIIFDSKSIGKIANKNIDKFTTPEEYMSGVQKIFSLVLKRNNEYKDSLEKGEGEIIYPQVMVIIKSISELKSILENYKQSDAVKLEASDDTPLNRLLFAMQKCQKEYNVNFIIAESVNLLNSFTIEAWYKAHVNGNSGIWIGNGINNQYRLTVSKKTEGFLAEIGEDFGYTIKESKATLVKLLQ